jgi:acyl carrier protein
VSDPIEGPAIAKIRELSGHEDVTRDTLLADAGLDSLDLMEWLSEIEFQTGQDIDIQGLDYQAMNDLTVREVLNLFVRDA